jgi:hypothetical protein
MPEQAQLPNGNGAGWTVRNRWNPSGSKGVAHTEVAVTFVELRDPIDELIRTTFVAPDHSSAPL